MNENGNEDEKKISQLNIEKSTLKSKKYEHMSTYTQPIKKISGLNKESIINNNDELNEIMSNSIDKNKEKDSNLEDIDNKLKKIVVENTSKELVNDIFSSLKREEINYDNYNENNNENENKNEINIDDNNNNNNENNISENNENENSENNNSGYNNDDNNNSENSENIYDF
jgi:hypothetical protein